MSAKDTFTANRASRSHGLVDQLTASFANALRTPEGVAESVALLWTDAEGEWRELVPRLRVALAQLYTLGPYDPAARTGPAIWLKCIVDRSLPEVAPPTGIIPILYLPKVSRQELRAAGECPPALQPLVELQYRGRVWHQPNGRDWSVEAFLVSEDGLGLDIAQDPTTREAMIRALPLLAEATVESLRGHRLDADDFDKLAVPDPVRDLLRWMSNPEAFRAGMDGARWQAFMSVCRSEFGLDPDQDGATAAATALATGGGRWDDLWERFAEAPRLYPGISRLLREPSAGQGKLAFDASRNPVANQQAEEYLSQEFVKIAGMAHRDAGERILKLEAEHGKRRNWVWAQLGESPFAVALQPLARLATLAKSSLGGTSVDSIAGAYASEGWRCDRVAMQALGATKTASETAVLSKVVRALYEPWLDSSNRHFQEMVAKEAAKFRSAVRGVKAEKDTCIVFADGLRFDIGGLLQEKLEGRALKVHLSYHIAPLPTVTATAKPVATPASDAMVGVGAPDDFMPVLTGSKQPAVTSRLRDEISRHKVEIIEPDELLIPGGSEGGGWTEIGRLDELGHKLGAGLATQIDTEVDRIADRVVALLGSGWHRVRIVTDHGWLLLPGGLPKFELPAYLVETKWARCAMVRGESLPDAPTYFWYWNPQVRIASPPGIACFRVGNEYAHGGVSLQECVVPEPVVEPGEETIKAVIASVQWKRMRCRVAVDTNNPDVRVDLRRNWKQSSTSIVASAKGVGPAGEASLVVEDESYEGAAAMVVVVDRSDNVLDRRSTIVGETQ